MTAAQWAPILGTVLVAAIAALGLAVSELIKAWKSKSAVRLENIQADQVMSSIHADIIADLQSDRRELRHIVAGLNQKVLALEKRIDHNADAARTALERATATEHRADRNIRKLQAHIGKLSDIMREAGLEVPDPPSLEQEELSAAIPTLMGEEAAKFKPGYGYKGKAPKL